jgi:plasminogen activator inhibitor 1 RNA-binding protein
VRAEKKEKVYLEIDAHFDRPSRGGRGRGGRGGDRGRGRDRGTRGRRGTNGTQPAVNVEDENAFPSLS